MARFDLFKNPNDQATHALLLDVQSDLVLTSTRWCIPLYAAQVGVPILTQAQVVIVLGDKRWILDTPNMLSVPRQWLRHAVSSLSGDDRTLVESALDFMLRGY